MATELRQVSKKPLLQAREIMQSFKKSDRQDMLVLDKLDLDLYENEIIAILGKSGSGKSTLLRILAGLTKPTTGHVYYAGQPVHEPIQGLSMVFQHFALMPWLTVLQNVQLGLEAQGVNRADCRQRALEAIDIIGLDGFESAYPKELSGGMLQRVGFARAIVVQPAVLLMDEPFSSLDVLTAENLRNDLLDLWLDRKMGIKSIVLVTHNIEEAASMADRILVFGHNPGFIRDEIKVDIPRPRDADDPAFRKLVDEVYTLMTTPEKERLPGLRYKAIGVGYRLPKVAISELTGFMEVLEEHEKGKVDLPELAEAFDLEIDDLFPITDVMEMMQFAIVSKGDIELTAAGKRFVTADILERKKIFAEHLIAYVPLARHIRQVLDDRPKHRSSEERFLAKLEDFLSEEAAEEVLATAIDWGRYAELFAYDYNTGVLSLENPE